MNLRKRGWRKFAPARLHEHSAIASVEQDSGKIPSRAVQSMHRSRLRQHSCTEVEDHPARDAGVAAHRDRLQPIAPILQECPEQPPPRTTTNPDPAPGAAAAAR